MRRYILFASAFCVVLLLLGMGFGSFVQHKKSLVSFMVAIPPNSTVKIYADQGGDAPFQYNPSKPLFTLSSSKEIKTKVGVYDFVIEPSTDYLTNVTKVTVNKSTAAVSINPDFSQAKLQAELAKNKDQILGSFYAQFNDAAKYYNVGDVQLYKHGEWAGLTLTPTSNQYDPARFVLHKQGGNWEVVNKPSIFVLGSLYKNVPEDVISAVNSL